MRAKFRLLPLGCNLLIASCIAICAQRSAAYAASTATAPNQTNTFGGAYKELGPSQRRLVDDWASRYSQRTKKTMTPQAVYDSAPVSSRSTFEAVTNALATTPLTSAKGEPLGSALDLVDHVETVKGRIPSARGDSQFRMYVTMKPGALATLIKCREFSRGSDNTVFHHGYPLNWRQGGGMPSIQISMAGDGKRADIDVDYRSSGFPSGLFNGHLTAANSDVRAGNNYTRHVKRWNGLANWWRNLFGLPVEFDGGFLAEPEHGIPKRPRLSASSPLPNVVSDFLSVWLVARKPNLAAAYVSTQAYPCVNQASGSEDQPIGREAVPLKLWNDLEETNFLLGKPAKLQDAVESVDVADPALRPISHQQAAIFHLAKVPDDVAAQLDCSGSTTSPPRKYGTYYGSTFRIKTPGERGAPIFLVWRQEQGYWKIVSVEMDPGEVKDGPVPDDTESVAAPPRPSVKLQAGPAMMNAMQAFFDALFIKKNPDLAFSYFAPSAYGCVNLALAPGERASAGAQDSANRLRRDLQQIASRSPSSPDLARVIESFDPGDPLLSNVRHAQEHAYLLAGVADTEASGFLCGPRPAKQAAISSPSSAPLTYGSYFGTFLKIIEAGDEAAGVGLLWGKDTESGNWKIIAWRVDEP
jgi:hypothetical protein